MFVCVCEKMVYVTQAELEEITGRSFSDDPATPLTATQIGKLVTQMSAKLDGVCAVDEGNFGNATTCPEWCKQAVLSACIMIVDNIYLNAENTELEILRVLNMFAKKRKSSTDTLPKFSQRIPDSSGEF